MGIAVLGPLTIDGVGGSLRHHDRVVLTVLAVRHGEPVSADRLADALWSDSPPETWSKVVQGCVVRLRKVLGTESIETTPHGYRLTVPADEVDSHRFERLLGRGREHLALSEPERAAYVLAEAIGLWRGPAFTELNDWPGGRVESARLDELHRDAEELRVDAALRAGQAREVLGDAQRLVGEAPLRERRWALLALAQYQAGQQAQALRTIRRVRTVLANELGLDPGSELVALEQAILRQDPELVVEAALRAPDAVCPYRGLVPYGLGDSDTFFGREAEVAECLRRLASRGVLAVVGPSGSGKSSLVRAGVAAALVHEGKRVHVVTPGRHPLDVLDGLTGPSPVLVVDQCEEAVTQSESPEERTRFFDRLVTHAEHTPLVLTLRADHLGGTTDHPAFARLLERGLFLIGPMDADQLRACIERPAQQSGLLLEPGLVDLLLREVEGEAGALPLLSHSLRETWGHREGRTLTVAGYHASGGIREAVARSAEEVYDKVPGESRPIVRDLMLRLVTSSPGGAPVRSRVPRRLVTDDEEHAAVVEQFVRARLLTSDDGVLVLAHEALVHAWPRFRQWLEDDTEGQRILRHLAVAADSWDTMGRPDSELYRGVRLAQALDWRQQSAPDLTVAERDFLTASQARVDADLHDARQRAQQERHARRRTRRLAAGLAAALALALIAAAGAIAFQQSASDRAVEADVASTEADANRLAALSKSVGSLDLSLLLAAEAVRTADTTATRDGLLTSLLDHDRAQQVLHLDTRPYSAALADHGGVLFLNMSSEVLAWPLGSTEGPTVAHRWGGHKSQYIATSPVDDLVAVAAYKDDETPRIGIYDSEGRRHLYLEGFDEIGGHPRAMAFSADGKRFFYVALDVDTPNVQRSWVKEYDLTSGRPISSRLLHRAVEPSAWLVSSMSRDGRRAVSWVEGESDARMLDTRTGRRVALQVPDRPTEALWFYSLSSGAAQSWEDGAVVLFDGSGRAAQVLQAHQDPVHDVIESPDGSWAATADDAGRIVVWDVDPRTGIWSQRETLQGHSGRVVSLSITPDGKRLMSASNDRTAVIWDMTDRAGLGAPVPGLVNRWMSNRPAVVEPGQLIVAPTRGAPGEREWWQQSRVSATFLDPRTSETVDRVYVGNNGGSTFGSSVSVSPDRSMVAVTYGYGTVVLNARTREKLARIELPDVESFGERKPENVWSTAWTPDGTRLLIGAEGDEFDPDDGGIVVVDTHTWEVAEDRVDVRGGVQTMEFSPDGQLLAVGMTAAGDDAPPGIVRLLDADTLEEVRELRMGVDDFAYDLTFSPDGRSLAVGVATGLVYTYDVASGERLHEPARAHNSWVGQVEWLPDGRTVVSTGEDARIVLYDAVRGVLRATLPASTRDALAYTYLLEVDNDGIAALAGERPGRRYPLDLRHWLDRACEIVGRNLTRDEWANYLPDRPYRRTCGDRT